jgi:hypothetical protein
MVLTAFGRSYGQTAVSGVRQLPSALSRVKISDKGVQRRLRNHDSSLGQDMSKEGANYWKMPSVLLVRGTVLRCSRLQLRRRLV